MAGRWGLKLVKAIAAFKRMGARSKKPRSNSEDFADAPEFGGLPVIAGW